MWKHFQRKLFKRLKGCAILVGMFVPQAEGTIVQMRRWGERSQFIRLFAFPVCEALSNSSPGAVHPCVCLRICLYVTASLTQDIITLSSLSKSSSSSSSRSSTACWRLQQMNERKKEIFVLKNRPICDSYIKDKHEITNGSSTEQLKWLIFTKADWFCLCLAGVG